MKKYIAGLMTAIMLVGGYYVYADTLNDIEIMVHDGNGFVPYVMVPTNGNYDSALIYDKDSEIYRMAELNTNQFDVSSQILSLKSSFTSGFVSTSSLATVATTGNYNDLINKPVIATSTVKTFSNPARSLNTCFQISTSTDALVTYSVDIAATLSLTSGQSGTVFLEYSDNSTCTTNTVEVARATNGNTGTLTAGLNLTQTMSANVGGIIPSSKYARLRTANGSGTPVFNFRSGQEVKF